MDSNGGTVLDAIETKKFGGELSDETIRGVVADYTDGEIPDYQMAALLMAIFIRGMGYEETLALTRAMAESGRTYAFPECVDKHSTGGVGDKVSLTALPIVAACGAPVAKLSGRGLGTTGGTIDKLESIPGFTVELSEDRFRRQVDEVGLAIIEAGDLAPADKAIYALRDTTGTVDSLPLIGSSIVCKKAATGAGHLLYDVKRGSGAFMKTTEDARELARLLVRLSESMGIRSSALITDMDNPLGSAVGNALEVRESVRFLAGEAVPEDLAAEARHVAAKLLDLKGVADPEDAVEEAISSGAALAKLAEFVRAQERRRGRPRRPARLGSRPGGDGPAKRPRRPVLGARGRTRRPRARRRPRDQGGPDRPGRRRRGPGKGRGRRRSGPARRPPLRRPRGRPGREPRARGPGNLRRARAGAPCYPGRPVKIAVSYQLSAVGFSCSG